jgi:dGTPase
MIGREEIEKREYEILSPYATKAAETKGRVYPEEKCDIRTEFQRDRDRIIHSKAFRRLMHKTQVFLAPEGDHYRTRLTHTIEVSQIARTICRGIGLNEDLAEAIAMGHDLGHTPFGHIGEKALNDIHEGGFRHNIQSLRVVDVLEGDPKKGGINLTAEVRDGILNHTGSTVPFTLEGQVVKTSDRIAYINHDIDDAIRSGIIKQEELPKDCIKHLGKDHRTRINTMVSDMIKSSYNKEIISMSRDVLKYMNELRDFMFVSVYLNSSVKKNENNEEVELIIKTLYEHYGKNENAKDMIAGMTDRYAIKTYEKLKKN